MEGGEGGGGVRGRGIVMYHLPIPPPSYLSLNTSVPTSAQSFGCSQVSSLEMCPINEQPLQGEDEYDDMSVAHLM